MKSINNNIQSANEIKIGKSPDVLVEEFNNFCLESAKTIRKIYDSEQIELINSNNKSMFLHPVSVEEIYNIIESLKNKWWSGIDDIPNTIIKVNVDQISVPLCHIINYSMKHGIFPYHIKIAVVKPIHKQGSETDPKNYRPINILPSFPKIFEISMCKRIMNFLLNSKIIKDNQHRYMKGRSTQQQYFKLLGKFCEDGEMSLGIFLDLSKGYDSIDREILHDKLEYLGVIS